MMPDEPKFDCLLVEEQNLAIGDQSLQVLRTELTKNGFGNFTLIAEISGNFGLCNNLFDGTASVRGQKLKCRYDGTIASATLEYASNQEFSLSNEHQIIHFICSDIEAAEGEGEFYEFLVPYAHFGQGDYVTRIDKGNGGFQQASDQIKFVTDGVEWNFRHLIEIDGVFHPADEAIRIQQDAGVQKFNLNPSAHAALQVKTNAIDREVAEETASDICWLLRLAFAQPVMWAEMRIRAGRTATFLCRRGYSLPNNSSGTKPIRNWMDGLIQKYIEAAIVPYRVDSGWWRETLNWYSISAENATVESSGMILSVMLDRISSRLLKEYGYEKQIGKDLAIVLEDRLQKKVLWEKMQALMQSFAAKWTIERTKSLVGMIQNWNDSPPLLKKIALAYAQVGLQPPSEELLKKRNLLAHEGRLDLEGMDGVNFYLDLNRQVLVLLFAMLKYEGKFFSLGQGECQMADFKLETPEPDTSTAPSNHTGKPG